MKPNNNTLYITKQRNHPSNILNNIPLATNKMISSISSNEDNFKSAAPVYQEALKGSGYNFQLMFEPQNNTSQKFKRTKTKNKTFFTPPFTLNVSTNIGKTFFNALDSSFLIGHPLKNYSIDILSKFSIEPCPTWDKTLQGIIPKSSP